MNRLLKAAIGASCMFTVQASFAAESTSLLLEKSSGTGAPSTHTATQLTTMGFLVDTGITYVESPDQEEWTAAAFDGTNYMVVWLSRRGSVDFSIYACRVTPAGLTLDPGGIFVSSYGVLYKGPSIAFNGVSFLVAWEDSRGGIYGARLSQSGQVLDVAGIQISSNAGTQGPPAVSSDGTSFLAVWWEDNVGDREVYGARINTGGIVLDPSGFAIGTGPDDQWLPQISFDGTNYLVIWRDDRNAGRYDVYGTRVTSSGTILDPSYIVVSTPGYQHYPHVQFGSSCYLVTWHEWSSGHNVHGSRIDPSGSVLDPGGFIISSASLDQTDAAIGFNGTDFLVAWDDKRNGPTDVYCARVSQSGTVLDPAGLFVVEETSDAAVASDGNNFLVVPSGVSGHRVDPSGSILDPTGFSISSSANYQYASDVAFNGSDYLVVWADLRGADLDIYGARVSLNGDLLDQTALPICLQQADQDMPAVSSNGDGFMVTWRDQRNGPAPISEIFGTRVSAQGATLDGAGIRISEAGLIVAEHPDVASDGADYYVVWYRYTNSTTRRDVYGARVSAAGEVLDTPSVAIAIANQEQQYPRIAFDGVNYLVVWQDALAGHSDIIGRRVGTDGVPINPSRINICTELYNQVLPAVAFDGSNYMVVWADGRAGVNAVPKIYAGRVRPNSSLLDGSGFPVAADSAHYTWPDITFDGTNFVAAWTEYPTITNDPDVKGAVIDTAGGVIQLFPIESGYGQIDEVALSAGNNSYLSTYSAWTPDIGGQRARAMRIMAQQFGNPSCCVGTRGDVNGDSNDLDIVDLTCVVDFLFGSGCAQPCEAEADVNGDSSVSDIVDLTFVVDWLFGVAPTLVPCF